MSFETEPCICGHTWLSHIDSLVNGLAPHSFSCSCKQFKLDNLKLVEDLAKDKGLI
jgi:hypothetical protein